MAAVMLVIMMLGVGFALPELFRGEKMSAARLNAGAIIFVLAYLLYVIVSI